MCLIQSILASACLIVLGLSPSLPPSLSALRTQSGAARLPACLPSGFLDMTFTRDCTRGAGDSAVAPAVSPKHVQEEEDWAGVADLAHSLGCVCQPRPETPETLRYIWGIAGAVLRTHIPTAGSDWAGLSLARPVSRGGDRAEVRWTTAYIHTCILPPRDLGGIGTCRYMYGTLYSLHVWLAGHMISLAVPSQVLLDPTRPGPTELTGPSGTRHAGSLARDPRRRPRCD